MGKYSIEKELSLYKIREFDNEDMRLKIEELKIGDEIKGISYSEKVQTSRKNIDNGYIMEQIELLQKKIRLNELANKKVDNILSILNDEQRKIIKYIYMDKLSINKTAEILYMSRKTVKRKLEKIFKQLEYFEK